jgi:hypothetical protein
VWQEISALPYGSVGNASFDHLVHARLDADITGAVNHAIVGYLLCPEY